MRRTSVLNLLLLALLWGSSFFWIKLALDGLNAMQVTVGRLVFGAAFLLALCAVRRQRLPTNRVLWGHLLVLSLFGNTLPFALFSYGERSIDSSLAGMLNATTPLWTAMVALLVRQERRPGPLRIAGLALGFAGTLVILAPWHGDGGSLGGSLMCLGAALCYGVTLVYSSRFVVNRGMPPTVVAAVQITSAAGWALLATPLFGWQPPHLTVLVAVAVVALGLLGTGYAFVLVNRLLVDEGPTSTASVTYLLPVIALLLGSVVLGEQVGLRVIAGMVVVLVGVMLTQRRPGVTPVVGPPPSATVRTDSTAASCATPTTRESRPS